MALHSIIASYICRYLPNPAELIMVSPIPDPALSEHPCHYGGRILLNFILYMSLNEIFCMIFIRLE